jgi:hypothetical protein
MTSSTDCPFLRDVKSPLTDDQLRPLDPRCERVQFVSPLTEKDHVKLARFLAAYPDTPLRIYGQYSNPLPNLSFLRHYRFLSGFEVDVFHLESTDGIDHLPSTLKYLGFGQTKSKNISLEFLLRFPRLKELYLEGHTKNIEVVSNLSNLERLTLRSITLPDLTLLLPLRQLWSLDIKLGGTKDLRLLPKVGSLKYLELWMIKGLQDLSAVAEIITLQNLFLQALKNVTSLPSFRNLQQLTRVTLDTMKGITDLCPIAEAPALEELLVFAANHLQPAALRPFIGHLTLKAATIDLGSIRKNEETQRMLGLPKCDGLKAEFTYR